MCSLLALATDAGQEASTPKPICSTDFESPDALGLFEKLVRHKLLVVREREGVAGSNALRATYRGTKEGSERIVTSFALPEKLDSATLVFDVKFGEDFQFRKGGKLHGLGPDHRITGGRKMKSDGWSARAMWRPNGISSYVYCQNKKNKYGQGPDRMHDHVFKKGRYYSISLYVQLNRPAKAANGVMRVYVDGKGVAEDTQIQFRSVEGEHTRITHLLFSTFHGGNGPSWAPKDMDGNYIDVHAYFDNIAVYDGLYVRQAPGPAEPAAESGD